MVASPAADPDNEALAGTSVSLLEAYCHQLRILNNQLRETLIFNDCVSGALHPADQQESLRAINHQDGWSTKRRDPTCLGGVGNNRRKPPIIKQPAAAVESFSKPQQKPSLVKKTALRERLQIRSGISNGIKSYQPAPFVQPSLNEQHSASMEKSRHYGVYPFSHCIPMPTRRFAMLGLPVSTFQMHQQWRPFLPLLPVIQVSSTTVSYSSSGMSNTTAAALIAGEVYMLPPFVQLAAAHATPSSARPRPRGST